MRRREFIGTLGNVQPELMEEFEKSAEWQRFEEALLAVSRRPTVQESGDPKFQQCDPPISPSEKAQFTSDRQPSPRVRSPSRVDVTKLATETFQAGAEQRNEQYSQEKTQAIALGRSRGHIDLNALCHCKATQLQREILALADAWVRAATTLEVPLEPWSERTFEKMATELHGMAINGFHEELDVISKESQIPLCPTIGDRQIETVMKSALSEQKRRLRSEGIKAAHAQMQQLLRGITVTPVVEETVYPGQVAVQYFQSSPQAPDGEMPSVYDGTEPLSREPKDESPIQEEGWVSVRRADWREDAAFASQEPPALLRPVRAARLGAIATLRKEASEAVQHGKPQSAHELEQKLWPPLSAYAIAVFDKSAEAKLRALGPGSRKKSYGSWLRSKCLLAVVADVCRPIFGQFTITVRYIAELIGDVSWPEEAVRTRRALWRVLADEVIPGAFTKNLERRVSITLQEERVPHWESRVTEHPPANDDTEASAQAPVPTKADKGNVDMLRGTDGKLKRVVTLDVARRFGGVSLRAIQDAARNGKLVTEGKRLQRRVLVDSLLGYFPPEK